MITKTLTLNTPEYDSVPNRHLLIESENSIWLEHELQNNNFDLKQKVDVIYIDPPYNTGNTHFVYDDKRTHDEWIAFMSKRLLLLKQFLTPTGVVVVSIDDSEVHYLRVLMDEIFGRKNFIAQITIDGGANKNNANFFSVTHEYMILYSNNVDKLKRNKIKWRQKREGIDLLLNEYQNLIKSNKPVEAITVHLKEWVKTQPLSKRLKVFYNADEQGLYTYADLSVPGNKYEYVVEHPITKKPVTEPSRGWGLSEEKFWDLEEQNLIIWGKDETKQPLKKLYLQDKKDQLMKSVLAYPARTPTHMLEKILGKTKSFDHPKNLQMMKDILDYITPENGIVLDCFAGTGTTGHAVLEINKENNTNRRFVLITNNENNIFDEVTLPRLEFAFTKAAVNESLEVWRTDKTS